MLFRPNNIVDHFKREHIINEKLCDFLPKIDYGKTDQTILQRWKDYFTARGVPWIITMTDTIPTNFTLWKKDERLITAEIDRERKDPNVNWFTEGR